MDKKYKIGLVVAGCAPIPDVLGGGAERLITLLAEENEKYDRVEFYIYTLQNTEAEALSRNFKHSKFFYFNYGTIIDRSLNFIIKSLRKMGIGENIRGRGYYPHILNATKKHNLDLIIDENGYVNDIGYFTDYYGKNKISTHIHCEVRPTEKGIDGLYGSTIGVSSFVIDRWKEYSNEKDLISKVVYSAVDEEKFSCTVTDEDRQIFRKKWELEPDDFVVMYCGRFHPDKGIQKLIGAIEYVDNPKIKFLVVGGENLSSEKESEFQKNIRKRASKYGKRVIFTGYVPNNELYKYYSIATMQVIPSICEEAAGLICIEGMYNGLPIVANISGGLPEYVTKECAVFLQRDDSLEKNIALAILNLYKDENLRNKMSMAALGRSKSFTKAKYYHDFVDAAIEIIEKEGEY